MKFSENLSQSLIDILNYRIQQEEKSGRIYKAMSIWLSFNGFFGASKLWKKYSEEEFVHAEFAYEYMLDLDIKPIVPAIESVNNEFTGLVEIIEKSYQHEQDVTNQCKELASKAFKEGDFMTFELAQKYLKEQIEELGKTTYWLDRITAFGTEKDVLQMIDNEMNEMAE